MLCTQTSYIDGSIENHICAFGTPSVKNSSIYQLKIHWRMLITPVYPQPKFRKQIIGIPKNSKAARTPGNSPTHFQKNIVKTAAAPRDSIRFDTLSRPACIREPAELSVASPGRRTDPRFRVRNISISGPQQQNLSAWTKLKSIMQM